MAWTDRLREAAITFPNGERFLFEYEDVEKEVNKKTNTFTFGDKDGALVQDFGLGAVSFPLTIFFSGSDYDLVADSFEVAAASPGTSLLEHPIYGNRNIVLESYTRTDRLKTAGNQAQFDLIMTETIIPIAPISATEGKSNIVSGLNDLSEIQQDAFDVQYDAVADIANAKNRITQFVKDFSSAFEGLTSFNQQISDAFDNNVNFINDNIDELLEDPPALAASMYSMVRIPARSTASVQSRVRGYIETLGLQIIAIEGAGVDLFNQRTERQLTTTSNLMALAESMIFAEDDLITKADATGLADDLLEQYRLLQEYLDQLERDSLTDDLENRYAVNDTLTQGIKSIVSATAGNLIQLSFSLKQERIIRTQSKETIITLCQELYGGRVEDPIVEGIIKTRLDFFIETNELTGEELILIPKDREIKYYI